MTSASHLAPEPISKPTAPFAERHIGVLDPADQQRMLDAVGYASLERLLADAVPASIREKLALALPPAGTEAEVAAELRALAARNTALTSMIGLGLLRHDHAGGDPAQRAREPGLVHGLHALPARDQPGPARGAAQLPDHGRGPHRAAGCRRLDARRGDRGGRGDGAVAPRRSARARSSSSTPTCCPQTLDVLRTRAMPVGHRGRGRTISTAALPDGDVFGVLVQYPGASGAVRDLGAARRGRPTSAALVTVVAADLLALTLLTPPGEVGADIAVGTTQRFGVPLGFGGPHAGYMAVRDGLERQLPGRLVGVSVDADGDPAYRLALQTREQHIRREKATSNICTAQVLLAVDRRDVRGLPRPGRADARSPRGCIDWPPSWPPDCARRGVEVADGPFFDTITVRVPGPRPRVVAAALATQASTCAWSTPTRSSIALRRDDRPEQLVAVLGGVRASTRPADIDRLDVDRGPQRVAERRSCARRRILTHPVFNTHHSETAMLRYLERLADKDYALDRGMIPLGSCTMKLNGSDRDGAGQPGRSSPTSIRSRRRISRRLPRRCSPTCEAWLAEVTGYDAVSLQPNAGCQGEFAGLLAIRGYHRAHGRPAPRRLPDPGQRPRHQRGQRGAGRHARRGRRDRRRAGQRRPRRPARQDRRARRRAGRADDHLPVDPRRLRGAHRQICALVHEAGGQVYVDGANLNALLGLARSGEFGATSRT